MWFHTSILACMMSAVCKLLHVALEPCLAQDLLHASWCMHCCLHHNKCWHGLLHRPPDLPNCTAAETGHLALQLDWATQRLCDLLPAGAIPSNAAKAGQESLSTFGTFGPPITGATPSTVVGEDDLTQALGGQLETADFTTRGFEPTPASASPNFANTTTVAVGASHDMLSPSLQSDNVQSAWRCSDT